MTNILRNDILSVLISKEEIEAKVKQMGARLTAFYEAQGVTELVVIGVLRGSAIFASDLVRHIEIPVYLDFIEAQSYGKNTETGGAVRILKDISEDIRGKSVLVVEDIMDTGLTLRRLFDMLWARGPRSLHLCAFLSKPSRRLVNMEPDFYCAEIPDEFVVGYGLDYAGLYRQLPDIAVLKPEVLKR